MANHDLGFEKEDKERIIALHQDLMTVLNSKDLIDGRFHNEYDGHYRDPGNRDLRRVHNSNTNFRLQGKMQLWHRWPGSFHQNRLTHSINAQDIAQDIATLIRKEVRDYTGGQNVFADMPWANPQYLLAATSAHDMGNPPFGHSGEAKLHELMKDFGGFEGNAQTLRILTELETKHPKYRGLNLTIRTLLGTIKYYRTLDMALAEAGNHPEARKFIYDEHYEMFQPYAPGMVRTLDAQIMDIADDISNVQGDLRDSLKLSLINMSQVLHYAEDQKDDSMFRFLKEQVVKAHAYAKQANSESGQPFEYFFTRQLSSYLVNELLHDIGFVKVSEEERKKTGSRHDYELKLKTLGPVVKLINDFIHQDVINGTEITEYEKMGEKVIESLFLLYKDNDRNGDNRLLPPEYRPRQGEDSAMRIRRIADYISGMTDEYAIERYTKFFGRDPMKEGLFVFPDIRGHKGI